jgi:hypothetical protein
MDDELKKMQQPLAQLPGATDAGLQPKNDTQALLMGQRPQAPQQQANYNPAGVVNPYLKGMGAPQTPPQTKPPVTDITQSEAYKTALNESRNLLSGKLPTGIQSGESAQLEALKKQQGEQTDKTREQYIQAGLGQSGAFVEGMGADKNQQLRDQIALGRDQNASRANIQLQQQQQGMNALQGLVGAEQAQIQANKQEALSYAGLSLEDKKLAQAGSQFTDKLEFDKWATTQGLDAEKAKQLWQSIENEKSRTSQEKVAFAGLSLEDRKLAQQGMQFGSELDFKKWATTSGIDAEKQKLLWQSIENEKQIQSQEKLAFAGLNLEDKKLAQQGMQFNTEMDFKKWATQSGLDAEKQKLLWQSIENEKKIQSEEKLAFAGLSIEDKKLAQNAMQFGSKLDFDKYALQAGLDQEKAKMIWQATENEKARLSAEKIAYADLDYKNKALAQEGMQFADKLSFDKWATQSGLDMKQKEMIWQSGEAEKERLSKENMFYKDLGVKEKELLHRIGIDTSKLALEEFAVKEGFNQQQIDRVFKATEMEKDRQNSLTLKNMDTDIEKWKTDETAKLTKLGWTQQEAMAKAELDGKKYLQAKDIAMQRDIEAGRMSREDAKIANQVNQFKTEADFKEQMRKDGVEEAKADRLWKTGERIQSEIANSLEADLDRQLQREVEKGRLSREDLKIANQAKQFDSEAAFKEQMRKDGLTEANADRIWKSKESALNLAHDASMKSLQMQMEKEGLNFQAMMKLSESLPVEQQAAFIAQAAKDAGMKYSAPASNVEVFGLNTTLENFIKSENRDQWNAYAKNMGMSANDAAMAWKSGAVPKGISLQVPGLKPLSPDEIAKGKTEAASKQWSVAAEKIAKGEVVTKEEIDAIAKSGNVAQYKAPKGEETWDARDSSGGYKATRFTSDTWDYLNANKGKLVKASMTGDKKDEKLYVIDSFWEPGESRNDRGKFSYVTYRDPVTNETIQQAVTELS